ncbi:hypothetical protein GVAV_000139 [Gurleya vavrai]
MALNQLLGAVVLDGSEEEKNHQKQVLTINSNNTDYSIFRNKPAYVKVHKKGNIKICDDLFYDIEYVDDYPKKNLKELDGYKASKARNKVQKPVSKVF